MHIRRLWHFPPARAVPPSKITVEEGSLTLTLNQLSQEHNGLKLGLLLGQTAPSKKRACIPTSKSSLTGVSIRICIRTYMIYAGSNIWFFSQLPRHDQH